MLGRTADQRGRLARRARRRAPRRRPAAPPGSRVSCSGVPGDRRRRLQRLGARRPARRPPPRRGPACPPSWPRTAPAGRTARRVWSARTRPPLCPTTSAVAGPTLPSSARAKAAVGASCRVPSRSTTPGTGRSASRSGVVGLPAQRHDLDEGVGARRPAPGSAARPASTPVSAATVADGGREVGRARGLQPDGDDRTVGDDRRAGAGRSSRPAAPARPGRAAPGRRSARGARPPARPPAARRRRCGAAAASCGTARAPRAPTAPAGRPWPRRRRGARRRPSPGRPVVGRRRRARRSAPATCPAGSGAARPGRTRPRRACRRPRRGEALRRAPGRRRRRRAARAAARHRGPPRAPRRRCRQARDLRRTRALGLLRAGACHDQPPSDRHAGRVRQRPASLRRVPAPSLTTARADPLRRPRPARATSTTCSTWSSWRRRGSASCTRTAGRCAATCSSPAPSATTWPRSRRRRREVDVTVQVERVGRTSFTVRHDLVDGGRAVARRPGRARRGRRRAPAAAGHGRGACPAARHEPAS